jgi:hypothetical protein
VRNAYGVARAGNVSASRCKKRLKKLTTSQSFAIEGLIARSQKRLVVAVQLVVFFCSSGVSVYS